MANNMLPPVSKKSRIVGLIVKAAQDQKVMDEIREARYANDTAPEAELC
jgi:hypothetical protein